MEGRRRDRLLTGLILAGMAAGVLLGLGAREIGALSSIVKGIAWIGVLFKQSLLLIIYPLVLASLFTGMIGLGDVRRTGHLAGRTVVYFAFTTVVSVGLGLFLVNLIEPGVGFSLPTDPSAAPPSLKSMSPGEFAIQMLQNTIQNPFAALAEGDVLGIIAFALLLGAVTTTLGEAGRPLIALFDSLNQALMRLTEWVMWLAPLGAMALIAGVVEAQGADALRALARYAATVLAGLTIHGFLILPLIAWVLGGFNPLRLLRALRKPMLIAFTTASSSATLPVTMEVVEEEMGIDRRIARFVPPLGATLNMDGTALYEAIAAMFIAQAYGIHLGVGEQIMVFLTASLAAVGAAGIPGAGLVTMGIVLTAVGLPLEGVGLILAVDRVLDMCRTTVNVEGDLIASAVIQRLTPASLLGDPDPPDLR